MWTDLKTSSLKKSSRAIRWLYTSCQRRIATNSPIQLQSLPTTWLISLTRHAQCGIYNRGNHRCLMDLRPTQKRQGGVVPTTNRVPVAGETIDTRREPIISTFLNKYSFWLHYKCLPFCAQINAVLTSHLRSFFMWPRITIGQNAITSDCGAQAPLAHLQCNLHTHGWGTSQKTEQKDYTSRDSRHLLWGSLLCMTGKPQKYIHMYVYRDREE